MDETTAGMHKIPWWCVACERREETTIYAAPEDLRDRVKPPKGWIRGRLDGHNVTLCFQCATDACVSFGDDPSPRIKRLVARYRAAKP